MYMAFSDSYRKQSVESDIVCTAFFEHSVQLCLLSDLNPWYTFSISHHATRSTLLAVSEIFDANK